MSEYVKVGTLEDFPPGEVRSRIINNDEQISVVSSDGKLYAVGGWCTHLKVSLRGSYVEHQWLWCWLHYSAFDMETGARMDGPAVDGIPVYDVRVDGEDVYVSVEARTSDLKPISH
jgi:3-phenylpropionate/trans-cinnamate dioxygenase ferredoxin subunit